MDNPFATVTIGFLFAPLWLIAGYYFVKTEKISKKELEVCRSQIIAYIIVYIFTSLIILFTNSIPSGFMFLGVAILTIAYLFKHASVIIWPIVPRNVKNRNFNLSSNIIAGTISLLVSCYLIINP